MLDFRWMSAIKMRETELDFWGLYLRSNCRYNSFIKISHFIA